jgi:hypothetical protein
LKWNRKIFFVLVALAVLVLSTPPRGASAFSGHTPEDRPGVQSPFTLSAAETSREVGTCEEYGAHEKAEKRIVEAARAAACDERILSLSRIFIAERLPREKSAGPAAAYAELVAANAASVALSKSETAPPVILSLPTRIAVRK